MEGDINGVRIIPRHIEFIDVEPNKLQKITVVVKNISNHSKAIRCHPPQSEVRGKFFDPLLRVYLGSRCRFYLDPTWPEKSG